MTTEQRVLAWLRKHCPDATMAAAGELLDIVQEGATPRYPTPDNPIGVGAALGWPSRQDFATEGGLGRMVPIQYVCRGTSTTIRL